ncbi:efflux RND transporter periplasmic adaptor subunit [Microvirga subterranea]|uniref:Membrane fusion protein (Multidrug efflux system) n=1 Tax=Microvirga subterranea TaxID=186651 RepID=A0A370H799_9HYPH|nr:efflux RND transporter periplasmic adaptor subunit [Microvirga subterranea]RDI52577.1 membrane fusion protein (multidrug efflux system) [Microvirga subterranea]
MARRVILIAVIGLVLAAALYAFYHRSSGGAPASRTAAGPPQQPPPEVGIIVAQPAEVPYPVEYAGRVAGYRDVEVRPRVGGLLLKREFEEGGRVKQDQVLFRIDPATYQVALSRAEAQLLQAQAALQQAEENFGRIEPLARRGVSTEAQLAEARSQRDQGRAGVQLAQAEVENAKLNLSYTTVTAPVAGITALQSPPEGALIQAQQTLLTTISVIDPAYVNFSVTDEEARAFRNLNEQRERPITEKDLTVEILIGQSATYPDKGRIDTAAQRVDPQTGTIQVRAIFPNADGVLLPGQFVRVRLYGVTVPQAIVVPQQAVSQGPQGPSVYVLGGNNVAQVRPIRLGAELASGWIVSEGLQGGERVIVDGVIRVRPGQPVRPSSVAVERKAEQSPSAPSAQPAGARP